MTANYTYANHTFKIETIYPYFHDFSKDYQTSLKEEFVIKINDEDLKYEKDHATSDYFKDDYLETLAVYRKVTAILIDYDILLIHGSCISIDNKAYLFCAKSGVGKSTHTRLIKERYGDRVNYINDDKPLIEIKDDYIKAYGTPWNGKHCLSTNISLDLNGIIFVNRGEINKIEKTDYEESFVPLFKQIHMPDKLKALNLMSKLKDLNYYTLYCNMNPDAAETTLKGLNL